MSEGMKVLLTVWPKERTRAKGACRHATLLADRLPRPGESLHFGAGNRALKVPVHEVIDGTERGVLPKVRILADDRFIDKLLRSGWNPVSAL